MGRLPGCCCRRGQRNNETKQGVGPSRCSRRCGVLDRPHCSGARRKGGPNAAGVSTPRRSGPRFGTRFGRCSCTSAIWSSFATLDQCLLCLAVHSALAGGGRFLGAFLHAAAALDAGLVGRHGLVAGLAAVVAGARGPHPAILDGAARFDAVVVRRIDARFVAFASVAIARCTHAFAAILDGAARLEAIFVRRLGARFVACASVAIAGVPERARRTRPRGPASMRASSSPVCAPARTGDGGCAAAALGEIGARADATTPSAEHPPDGWSLRRHRAVQSGLRRPEAGRRSRHRIPLQLTQPYRLFGPERPVDRDTHVPPARRRLTSVSRTERSPFGTCLTPKHRHGSTLAEHRDGARWRVPGLAWIS